jgi:hypothetical protein
MRSTGPILAVGLVTITNESVVNSKPIDWRIPIATGLAVGMFALLEHADADIAVDLAWLALISVLFVRVQPNTPAPVEGFLTWWNAGKSGS